MAFSEKDRARLLAVKGVGPRVIQRLEDLGFSEFAELADADAREVTNAIAEEINAPCWRNNPQPIRAIEGAIRLAQKVLEEEA